MQLEDILEGRVSTDEIDTSKFMLTGTNIQGLRSIKLRSTMELLQLEAAKLSDEDFRKQYMIKQYEISFIDYLIDLSTINLAEANNKVKSNTED